MRWLAWKLVGIPSVVLTDFDGHEVRRFVRRDAVGPWCARIGGINEVRLRAGGSITTTRRDNPNRISWVDSWRPLYGTVRP